MRKMLYSHLYNYLLIYIQFSIQQGYESHGRERDMFLPVCEQMAMI